MAYVRAIDTSHFQERVARASGISSPFFLLEGSPLPNFLYSSTITVGGGPFCPQTQSGLALRTRCPFSQTRAPGVVGCTRGAGRGSHAGFYLRSDS